MDEGDGGINWDDYEQPKVAAAAAPRGAAGLVGYIMPWLCCLIPGRLYLGPFIARYKTAQYLYHVLKVTHIVNMCAPTPNDLTEAGFHKSTRYEAYYTNKETKEYTGPEIVREPLPEGFATMRNPAQIGFYLEAAIRVAAILRKSANAVIYIHDQSGCDEEAFLGLMTWATLKKDSFPADVPKWLADNHYDRLLQNGDQRELLAEAIVKVVDQGAAERAKNAKGSISGWLATNKKRKT